MRNSILLPMLGILAFYCMNVSAQGWTVAARQLPPPDGASAAVRSAIADSGQPNIAARMQVPESAAAWQQLIAARAALPPGYLDKLAGQLGVRISSDTIAGVPVHRVEPRKMSAENAGRLFLYLHGGAYVFGGGDAGVREGALISAITGLPVISVDYRMPPDHSGTAAVQDVVAVYRALLGQYSSAAIAMGGTSAGGGLSLAVVHKLKAGSIDVPAALYLGTPWADLTDTSDSLHTNEGVDRVLLTYDGLLKACALLYAGERPLTDPLVSPVYGDFSGFPPTYLVSGTRDMLLSDTVRVHRKLRVAGIVADLNVYEGVSHAEYAMVAGSPEWQQVYGELKSFLQQHLQSAVPARAVGG